MQVNIKGKNVELTESLKDYARKKIEKISKYFDHIISGDITFSTERQMHIVEVNISVNGEVLRGKEKTGDMYSSIDKVVDKLETQIKKIKDKYNKKHNVESIRTKNLTQDETDSEEERSIDSRIVHVKSFNMGKPMMVPEAIKEMDQLGHDFFVFLNADNSRVNVVYVKKHGYGIIDPVVQ